jgi:transposase
MDSARKELLRVWSQAQGTPPHVVRRCRIILLKAEGLTDRQIAEELAINRHTCRLWRQRFEESGPEALWQIAPGRGRKPTPGLAESVVRTTLETRPEGQTHWSTRALAARQGVHASTVWRIWQEHRVNPRHQEPSKLPGRARPAGGEPLVH